MANYNPYSTQFFPQSQGNVYIINNSMEIANIPISGGLSVALCPNEALMYIKSIQNGAKISKRRLKVIERGEDFGPPFFLFIPIVQFLLFDFFYLKQIFQFQ